MIIGKDSKGIKDGLKLHMGVGGGGDGSANSGTYFYVGALGSVAEF